MPYQLVRPYLLGLYSLSGETSYRKISWSLEAARFGSKLFQSLWNLAGTSATLLPMCLSNFRAIRPLQHPISRLRDFTRFGGKTSYRLVNRGQGPMMTSWHGNALSITGLTWEESTIARGFFWLICYCSLWLFSGAWVLILYFRFSVIWSRVSLSNEVFDGFSHKKPVMWSIFLYFCSWSEETVERTVKLAVIWAPWFSCDVTVMKTQVYIPRICWMIYVLYGGI